MDAWRTFLAQYPIKKYNKGQTIVCHDVAQACCFVVKRGYVKTYSISADGTERPISFETKNDIFPFGQLFGHEEMKYFYRAYTTTEVYIVPRADFMHKIATHPRFNKRMTDYLIQRLQLYYDHIASLTQTKAFDKLVCVLSMLTKRFGRATKREQYLQMALPLTQQDLANFLGLTRETTGMQLKALEKEGILEYSRRQFIIHVDRLHALAEQR